MSTSVSNNSKWTTNNSWPFLWPFLWPFYFHPPLQHELTLEINMSSCMKSTWAHPGNHIDPSWKPPPTTRVFYQQDLSTGYTCQPKKTNLLPIQLKKTNLTHNYVIWTNRLNHLNCPNRLNPSEQTPSKPYQRLTHIEIPNNPI